MTTEEKTELKLDIGKIPEILLDNTDRNRTSPFAFTGNRFEFRAVGSSANCASGLTILNTAMANQLREFKQSVDAQIAKGLKKDEAILQVLRRFIVKSKKVRFEGNGYGQEWIDEAAKRGLSNISDVPEALDAYISKPSIKLFTENSVLNKIELNARYEIRLETYIKSIQIEARVLGDLAINHIIPTLIKYQNILIENVRGIKEILSEEDVNELASLQIRDIKEISKRKHLIEKMVKEMIIARKFANKIGNTREKAKEYSLKVKPYLAEIRIHIDKLELLVDDEIWPLPKYRELLFAR